MFAQQKLSRTCGMLLSLRDKSLAHICNPAHLYGFRPRRIGGRVRDGVPFTVNDGGRPSAKLEPKMSRVGLHVVVSSHNRCSAVSCFIIRLPMMATSEEEASGTTSELACLQNQENA